MKINKAPEKIYLVIDPIWGSMSVNYNCNDTDNIEYTRTDAFIKKACEYLNKTCRGFLLTERDIEDFKNYMKGE